MPTGLAELRGFYDDVAIGNATSRPTSSTKASATCCLQSMASELQMLAAQLYRIAQQHRASRDFTRPALQRALREVIACMTVYRTYVRARQLGRQRGRLSHRHDGRPHGEAPQSHAADVGVRFHRVGAAARASADARPTSKRPSGASSRSSCSK